MVKGFIKFLIIVTIPCLLCCSRIGETNLDITKDQIGDNWKYFTSNTTLIFDNLHISAHSYTIYFPFVLIEIYQRPNLTLILRNENTILVNTIGSLSCANAFSFWGINRNKFIIQGDGKLTIKVDIKKDSLGEPKGLEISRSIFVIRENAKVEIIMNFPGDIIGLSAEYGLEMEGNSQLSVYIGNKKGNYYGIYSYMMLSGNVTINTSIFDKNQSSQRWIHPLKDIGLNNYTNVTFISNGSMKFPKEFFNYLGEDPIIINAIETLEEFKKSHILTQLDEREPLIFSNYFTEKKRENSAGIFIGKSFFTLLNLILLIY